MASFLSELHKVTEGIKGTERPWPLPSSPPPLIQPPQPPVQRVPAGEGLLSELSVGGGLGGAQPEKVWGGMGRYEEVWGGCGEAVGLNEKCGK